jgi:hypothetical protein
MYGGQTGPASGAAGKMCAWAELRASPAAAGNRSGDRGIGSRAGARQTRVIIAAAIVLVAGVVILDPDIGHCAAALIFGMIGYAMIRGTLR